MPVATQHPPVTQTKLAAIFGVTTDTVRGWERAGCPVERKGGKGRPSEYRPADVIRWKEDRAVQAATGKLPSADHDELRRRKIAAEVTLAELALAERQRQLVSVDLAIGMVADMLAALRGRLLSIPSRVAPRLTLARNQAEAFETVQSAIHEALEEISSNPVAFLGKEKAKPEASEG